MGREVRMVPPDWEHPLRDDGREGFQPMFDEPYEKAAAEWKAGYEHWKTEPKDDCEYWEWECDPPDRRYYRPDWKEGQATHYQLYETVSEGTPVTPAFATLEELAKYLSENGDYWFQLDEREGRRTHRTKPNYEDALAMVKSGWACSMVVANGQILGTYEQHQPQDQP